MEYHTFYINLDKRTDRREQIESELQRMGLKGERFPAVYHEFGAYGCSMSHYKVLRLAKTRGYKNVLILEDDFHCIVSKEIFDETMKGLATMEFDVVMLSYNMIRSEPYSFSLMKVEEAQTASAYIVNEKFYDTLIGVFEKNMPLLIQTRDSSKYICDQCWKVLQPGSRWYATVERIGLQRESYSDIEGRIVNYGV
jgi:GR25 family glycosyltransferase involved in LPS biosynthesis